MREPEAMKSRRVVITGLGPVTAAGVGKASFWRGVRSGESPIRGISRFDPSPFRSRIAAEVEGFNPPEFMEASRARRLDRFGQFAVAAARSALDDADLDPSSLDPERGAVQMGSALGGIGKAEQEYPRYLDRGVKAVDPRLALLVFGGAASCNVAIEFGFCGPNSTNSMSCASGTIAVGDAFKLIRDGSADVALAGGVEAPLAPLTYGAFAVIRAMSTRNQDPSRACRPFDADRDGFVMGEGACVMVLEEAEHARRRGAHVYAEVLGYGNTNDAHHMTAPRPDGSQAARAMRNAMADARVAADQIDYVNAHGSSTPLNDSTESLAIRTVLGEHAYGIPVSGTKPYYGHALGASGAIETAVCCLALDEGWVPPTLNFEEPGEGCDLDYVTDGGRNSRMKRLITNSFGFGGINASLVLARWDAGSTMGAA